MAKKHQVKKAPVRWETVLPILCAVAFFVLVCLSAVSTVKGTAVFCVVLALLAGLIGFRNLRERFHLPMLALALMVLMGGVSTFYAVAGKFALREFLKVLIAFCLAVVMLAAAKGKGAAPGRRIAFVLEWGAAISGVVSIDLISTRWISNVVISLLNKVNLDYFGLTGVEPGVRMTSLFQNPNVFAAIMAIGVMLSLGLVLSAEKERERVGHTVCLYINSLAFVLAFSMGAIAMIAVAFLVYLLLEVKQRRAALFVLMAETLILVLLGVVLVAMTSLDAWTGVQVVPLLCLIVGAAALCVVDKYVGRKVADVLEQHSRVLIVVIAVALVAALGFGLLAYSLTGSATLGAGESLQRSAYPAPGEYTLDVQADGAVNVSIATQNKQDTMMHTRTELYAGPAAGAAFTVPEDSMVVWFTFSSADGATVHTAACQGAEVEKIPLGYKLLPGFISNRLQGLFANQNAIQRTVFFEDGMKLFARSPIVGSGLGYYENGVMSVQSFFYETKYAHNHYIQAMAETGVVGLVLFLGVLATSAAAVWLERRKKELSHPLTPALGAALVFMAGHAAVEVDFSYFAYLPFAFGVFALISLCCGETLDAKWFSIKTRSWSLGAVGVLVVVFTGFLISNMAAAKLVEKTPTFDSLDRAVKMDAFEYNDYKLAYVNSSGNALDIPQVQQQAQKYAAELAEVRSNTIAIYLTAYYLANGQVEQGMATAEQFVSYRPSDANAWNQAFDMLAAYADGSEAYRQGVERIVNVLQAWNEENLGTIELREIDRAFLNSLGIAAD